MAGGAASGNRKQPQRTNAREIRSAAPPAKFWTFTMSNSRALVGDARRGFTLHRRRREDSAHATVLCAQPRSRAPTVAGALLARFAQVVACADAHAWKLKSWSSFAGHFGPSCSLAEGFGLPSVS